MSRDRKNTGRPDSWAHYWIQFVLSQFGSILRAKGGAWEMIDLDSVWIEFDDAVRFVRDSGAPFELGSYDAEGGRSFPLYQTPDNMFRSSHRFGLLHVHPGTEQAILLYHAEGDRNRCNPLLAAGRSADSALAFARDVRTFAREDRRHGDRRVTILGDKDRRVETSVEWDDILLPAHLKSDIRRNVDGFFGMRDRYQKLGISYQRGFLMVGPPGNGKTSICRAIAHTVDVPFVQLISNDAVDDYDLSRAFSMVRDLAPAILCIEDIDALLSGEASLSCFLNQLDGLHSNDGVLTIATTNKPEKIDPAITNRPSRFDRVWTIGLPALQERHRLLRILLADSNDARSIVRIARRTEGLSMAAVKEVFVSACLLAFDRNLPQPDDDCFAIAISLIRGQSEGVAVDFRPRGPVGFAAGIERFRNQAAR